MADQIPPPPAGFVPADQMASSSAIPPPPAGFVPVDTTPSIGTDLLQSIPADIKGAASTLGGLPGDILDLAHMARGYLMGDQGQQQGQDWLSQGDQWLNSKLGTNPDTKILRPLNSPEITQGLDTLTGGPSYQPRTQTGKDILLGAQLAPTMIGGPESLATKFSTRVAGPVLGSEIGGQVAQAAGLPDEYGRIAGLLAGGPITAIAHGAGEISNARQIFPATQTLHDAASADFTSAGLDNVRLNPVGFKNWAAQLSQDVADSGYNAGKKSLQDVNAVLLDIAKTTDTPSLTMKTVEQLRQQVGDLYKVHGGDAELVHKYANMLSDGIDNYTNKLSGNDVLAGNASQANAIVTTARDLWSRYKKASAIDRIVTLAENKGGVNYNDAGTQTAIRQGINNLLTQIAKKQVVGWKPDEIAALQKAAQGGGLVNAARYLGRFAPHGLVSTALSGAVGGATLTGVLSPLLGPLAPYAAFAAPPLVGEVAGRIGHYLTLRAANHARDVAAAGGKIAPLPRMMAPQGLLGLGYGLAPALANEGGNQPAPPLAVGGLLQIPPRKRQ